MISKLPATTPTTHTTQKSTGLRRSRSFLNLCELSTGESNLVLNPEHFGGAKKMHFHSEEKEIQPPKKIQPEEEIQPHINNRPKTYKDAQINFQQLTTIHSKLLKDQERLEEKLFILENNFSNNIKNKFLILKLQDEIKCIEKKIEIALLNVQAAKKETTWLKAETLVNEILFNFEKNEEKNIQMNTLKASTLQKMPSSMKNAIEFYLAKLEENQRAIRKLAYLGEKRKHYTEEGLKPHAINKSLCYFSYYMLQELDCRILQAEEELDDTESELDNSTPAIRIIMEYTEDFIENKKCSIEQIANIGQEIIEFFGEFNHLVEKITGKYDHNPVLKKDRVIDAIETKKLMLQRQKPLV